MERSVMMKTWRRHPVLITTFSLSLIATLYFLGHLVFHLIYWETHENVPIQPWMTVGYVGKSWGVKPRALDQEAGLPIPEGRPLTLAEIAAKRGVPVETLIADVEAAVQRLKAKRDEGAPR